MVRIEGDRFVGVKMCAWMAEQSATVGVMILVRRLRVAAVMRMWKGGVVAGRKEERAS